MDGVQFSRGRIAQRRRQAGYAQVPRESKRGEQGGRESRERKDDGGKKAKPRRHRKEKRQKQTTEPSKGRGRSSSIAEEAKPEPELGADEMAEGRALQEKREGKAHSSQQKIKVVGLNAA